MRNERLESCSYHGGNIRQRGKRWWFAPRLMSLIPLRTLCHRKARISPANPLYVFTAVGIQYQNQTIEAWHFLWDSGNKLWLKFDQRTSVNPNPQRLGSEACEAFGCFI